MVNQATPYKSPAHSSTGTRSDFYESSHCLSDHGFMFYFTPLQGFSFTFPSRYCFTIGHSGVFSLTRWSSLIHTGFHVSRTTRDKNMSKQSFGLRDFHLLWCRIQLLHLTCLTNVFLPTTPVSRFRLFPVRSPLLRKSRLLSSPSATKMFQFTELAS